MTGGLGAPGRYLTSHGETVYRTRIGVNPLPRDLVLTPMNETHKVLHPRTTNREPKDRKMAQSGARFESYVHAAMKEAGLPTLAELYRQSGVGASTWSGWFLGKHEPRRNLLTLAGQALSKTPEQLLAVWDGERPQKPRRPTETPDPLVSALHAQTVAIDALVERLDTFVGPLGEVVADLLREKVRAATDRSRSGAPTS